MFALSGDRREGARTARRLASQSSHESLLARASFMRKLVTLPLLLQVAAAAPQCDGTLSINGRACCPISCGGKCASGERCASKDPANERIRASCCPDVLLTVAPPCTETGGAPCTMPVPAAAGAAQPRRWPSEEQPSDHLPVGALLSWAGAPPTPCARRCAWQQLFVQHVTE